MSSSSWKQKAEGILGDHYKNRSKISNLAGLMSMRYLEATAQEQLKNQEAESSFVRRKLWGASEDASGTSGTSETQMNGHTILGDIVVPQPPQPQASNVPAIAAMVAALGLGGMGTYILTRDEQPRPIVAPVEQEPPSFDDESLSIGLGQIDDYQLPKVE